MSGSPGTGGSNPRKFSEKIALHNQKQAEETRAFEQLMTDLTVSRVNTSSFVLRLLFRCCFLFLSPELWFWLSHPICWLRFFFVALIYFFHAFIQHHWTLCCKSIKDKCGLHLFFSGCHAFLLQYYHQRNRKYKSGKLKLAPLTQTFSRCCSERVQPKDSLLSVQMWTFRCCTSWFQTVPTKSGTKSGIHPEWILDLYLPHYFQVFIYPTQKKTCSLYCFYIMVFQEKNNFDIILTHVHTLQLNFTAEVYIKLDCCLSPLMLEQRGFDRCLTDVTL